MTTTTATPPPAPVRWLNTKQVAERTGYTVTTLRTMRSRGGGPPFIKVEDKPNSRARYPEDKLEAWMKEREGRADGPSS